MIYLFDFWLAGSSWLRVGFLSLGLAGGLLRAVEHRFSAHWCTGLRNRNTLALVAWDMWSGILTRDRNHIPYFGRRILIPWTAMEPVLFYFQKNPKMTLWIFTLLNSPWPVGRQRGLYIRRKWSKVRSLTSCPLEPRDEGITRSGESIHVCHCSGTCKRGCFREGWACDAGGFHLFNVILYLGTRPLPSRMEVIHAPVTRVLATWKASPVPIPHHSGGSGLPSIREEGLLLLLPPHRESLNPEG